MNATSPGSLQNIKDAVRKPTLDLIHKKTKFMNTDLDRYSVHSLTG